MEQTKWDIKGEICLIPNCASAFCTLGGSQQRGEKRFRTCRACVLTTQAKLNKVALLHGLRSV